MTDGREALEEAIKPFEALVRFQTDRSTGYIHAHPSLCKEAPCIAAHQAKDIDIMAAADTYAAAERLKEHVKVCGVYTVTDRRLDCGDSDANGDKWHCDRAPIKVKP